MNALAVEVAAREDVRTVWLPTVDSVNESHERDVPPGAAVPVGQDRLVGVDRAFGVVDRSWAGIQPAG
jgi:hypothetical protein